MDILFITQHLKKEFTDPKKLLKVHGAKRTKIIKRRMATLRAADSLVDLRLLPGHCHELTGDRAGQITIALDGPYRLIFEPANEPVPRLQDGGLDWDRVTAIRILEVVDYHG